ncbi:hypothetical protein DSO57_1000026 [Entomophthora muscae]|uniref:Uncharacterized protein n=1 Tax=Entomophthora muscae TaxID=34485 RepID=A0ACC2SMB0_9FUNG|nr:hypothetical protein DSO57_1000026 [Entomophthora muscae]
MKVSTNLGSEISNPANEKSLVPVCILRLVTCSENPPSTISTNNNPPTPDAISFPDIPAYDTGRLGNKINNSTNENCPKPAQSLENGINPEHLLNTNYQVDKQKSSKDYSAEIANDNLLVPDAPYHP